MKTHYYSHKKNCVACRKDTSSRYWWVVPENDVVEVAYICGPVCAKSFALRYNTIYPLFESKIEAVQNYVTTTLCAHQVTEALSTELS